MKYFKNGVYYVQAYDLVELSALINDSLMWEQLGFPKEHFLALCNLIHKNISGSAIAATEPEKDQLIISNKCKNEEHNKFREFVPFLRGAKAKKWLEEQEWIPDYDEFLNMDPDDLNSLIVLLADKSYSRKREMEKTWEDGQDAIRVAKHLPGVTPSELEELTKCVLKGMEDTCDQIIDSITSNYRRLSLELGKIHREDDAKLLV